MVVDREFATVPQSYEAANIYRHLGGTPGVLLALALTKWDFSRLPAVLSALSRHSGPGSVKLDTDSQQNVFLMGCVGAGLYRAVASDSLLFRYLRPQSSEIENFYSTLRAAVPLTRGAQRRELEARTRTLDSLVSRHSP
jgi:hypothetical protein